MIFIIGLEHKKSIEFLSNAISNLTEARSKLKEIKSSNETMFRNYKKAKIYILREVE